MGQTLRVDRRQEQGSVLALGFGTTVAMWIVGYLLRLPGVEAPAWMLLIVFVGLLVVGGVVTGCVTRGGAMRGAAVGLLVAALDMLVLGSLLSGDRPGAVRPSALLFVPGALAFGAVLGAAGAAVGAAIRRRRGLPRLGQGVFVSAFAIVAAVATLSLVLIGGLVTSNEAGLAVVDWPNSYGYNMFLYPLSRMTGGIYYEHAHRLFGALVGLTTLGLAGLLIATDRRSGVRRAALLAVVLVIVQGVLGGLRVTGHFTLSTSSEAMRPSIALAIVHGVTGQAFFALLVGLAVVTSGAWRARTEARAHRSAASDRTLSALLILALFAQLALGALYRHSGRGLVFHISWAAVVALLAVMVGLRAWAFYGIPERGGFPLLRRLGHGLLLVVGIQLLLGVGALAAVLARGPAGRPPLLEVLVATAHQVTGALLLGLSVVLALWLRRLTLPVPAETGQAGEERRPDRSSPAP